MKKRKHVKYIHEGVYAAEIDVELLDSDEGWGPYLSLDDAVKIDTVREALRNDDLTLASNYARVFTLHPAAI